MKHTKVFRDANHLEIVKNLRREGFSVIDLAAVGNSVPDIVVANSTGSTILTEIKMPTGRFYLSQLRFLATWKGWCGFAETTEHVIAMINDPDGFCLQPWQRQIIIEIVEEDLADPGRRGKASLGKEQITVKKFEKIYGEKMNDYLNAEYKRKQQERHDRGPIEGEFIY